MIKGWNKCETRTRLACVQKETWVTILVENVEGTNSLGKPRFKSKENITF